MPGRILLLFAVLLMGFQQPRLVKTKVTENITVLLPKDWRPMDGLDFNDRYPSVRAPLAAYTDNDRLVDFAINISATQWPDANLAIAQQFFKASLNNMFDRVSMIDEGIREVHGKKYIYFEFESRVNGTRADESLRDPILKYTHLQYLIEPGRTLVFSFNCHRRGRETWKPISHEMMNSIRIK